MFFILHFMLTEYYCPNCREAFQEEKLPNMHKKHRVCGSLARILRFHKEEKDK